jgi:methionyl-tRNA formyltransferase
VSETPGGTIRVVYFGTPAYAAPALRALASDPRVSVELVVTQPDRPAGRGHSLNQSAVKIAALELGLPVYQPEALRRESDRLPLVAANPDLFVVAAYGLIFGAKTLAIPRFGALNLHASLLPRYRGASPITAAILAGDRETGVTLMAMDIGMDTGNIIEIAATGIASDDTTGSLTAKLAENGAELLMRVLNSTPLHDLRGSPQPAEGASLVRPLVKADGWIDWRRPAAEIERQIRAMQPWPKTFTTLPSGASMQITRARVVSGTSGEPGAVIVSGREVLVATESGLLALDRAQVAGSAEMDGELLVRGRKLADGDRLGQMGVPESPPPLIRSA